MNTRDLVLSALFAAIIVALGLLPPIPIGIIPVPITAQSLGVMLAGVVLGAKRGTIAVLLVVVLVTIGLPVLSGGRGGLAVFVGPTAGFFVGWGTLTLINAGLAQGKNRSGLLWWLLSLFLGPLATLILVILPKVRTKLF